MHVATGAAVRRGVRRQRRVRRSHRQRYRVVQQHRLVVVAAAAAAATAATCAHLMLQMRMMVRVRRLDVVIDDTVVCVHVAALAVAGRRASADGRLVVAAKVDGQAVVVGQVDQAVVLAIDNARVHRDWKQCATDKRRRRQAHWPRGHSLATCRSAVVVVVVVDVDVVVHRQRMV